MSVSIDTSFDFGEKILYICVVIFRRKHVAKLFYEEVLRAVGVTRIHARKFDRKKKENFLNYECSYHYDCSQLLTKLLNIGIKCVDKNA